MTGAQPASKRLLTEANAANGFAPISAPYRMVSGRRWLFEGDSITAGTGAVFGRHWAYIVGDILGGVAVAPLPGVGVVAGAIPGTQHLSVNGGIAGQTSAQILARIATDIATNNPDGVTLLCGTNDVAQGVPMATWQANVAAIAKICQQAGVALVVGTVPPQAGQTNQAARRAQINAMNLWLRLWGPRNGVPIAAVHKALADPATSDLLAAYNYDNIHPNTAGHLQVGQAFAAAMATVIPPSAGLIASKGLGQITNPLMTGGSTSALASEWTTMFGGTGTAGVLSTQPQSDPLLAGQWSQNDFDAASSGGVQGIVANYTPGVTVLTPGGLALLVAQVQIVDVTGNYLAKEALESGASWWAINAQNGGNTAVYATAGGSHPGTLAPGPVLVPFVVPAGVTTAQIWFKFNLPVGTHAKFRIGCADIIDLSALGSPDLTLY